MSHLTRGSNIINMLSNASASKLPTCNYSAQKNVDSFRNVLSKEPQSTFEYAQDKKQGIWNIKNAQASEKHDNKPIKSEISLSKSITPETPELIDENNAFDCNTSQDMKQPLIHGVTQALLLQTNNVNPYTSESTIEALQVATKLNDVNIADEDNNLLHVSEEVATKDEQVIDLGDSIAAVNNDSMLAMQFTPQCFLGQKHDTQKIITETALNDLSSVYTTVDRSDVNQTQSSNFSNSLLFTLNEQPVEFARQINQDVAENMDMSFSLHTASSGEENIIKASTIAYKAHNNKQVAANISEIDSETKPAENSLHHTSNIAVANQQHEYTGAVIDKIELVDNQQSVSFRSIPSAKTSAELNVIAHDQVVVAIKSAVNHKVEEIHIKMYPEELGTVIVTVEFNHQQATANESVISAIKITAEQPDTLKLLEQDSGTMLERIKTMGNTENASLSFDLKGDDDSTGYTSMNGGNTGNHHNQHLQHQFLAELQHNNIIQTTSTHSNVDNSDTAILTADNFNDLPPDYHYGNVAINIKA